MQDEDRFWSRVVKTKTCWLWTGATVCGYGVMRVRKKRMKVHRFSYEIHHGSVPESHHVHHICGVKLCIHPDHIKAMDGSDHHVHHNSRNVGIAHRYPNSPWENKGR